MLSKRKAEAASEALLKSARQQRDRTSPLLARFPELIEVPFTEREAMVRSASAKVWKRWPMMLALGAVIIVAALWVWAVIMKLEFADDIWWFPFLAAFTSYQAGQSLIRRELRRALARRRSEDRQGARSPAAGGAVQAIRMHAHKAHICWRRDGEKFIDHRYSRAHQWHFDGGTRLKASASPANVPEPYSDPQAVDPEEALVAAASSCHMLWFLALAARRGFVVDSYEDEASGTVETDQSGRKAFSRITLHPQVTFSGKHPSEPDLAEMHDEAHNNCFIANSLRCDVVVGAA